MKNEGAPAEQKDAIPIGTSEEVLDESTKEYVDHVDDILEDIHQDNPSLPFNERLQLQKEAVDNLIKEWELLATASTVPDEGLALAISYAKERRAAMTVLGERVQPELTS